MSSNYIKINGKNYVGKVIREAEGKADLKKGSKLSLTVARGIFKGLSFESLNETEIRTVSYILEKYSFTEPALKWIEKMLSQSDSHEDTPIAPEEKGYGTYEESEKNIADLNDKDENRISLKKIIISLIIFAALIAAAGVFLMKKEKTKPQTAIEDDKITIYDESALEKVSAEKADINQITPASEVVTGDVEPEVKLYVVKNKDTLIKISIDLYGNYSRWKDIYNLNKDVVKDPAMLFPGQKLKLP